MILFCKHTFETLRIEEETYAEDGYNLDTLYFHDMICTKCFRVKKHVKSNKAELMELVNQKKIELGGK